MLNREETDLVLGAKQIGHCADRYLKIYIADIDWEPHIKTLWGLISRKKKTPEDLRNIIAATVLLPSKDRTTYIDKEHPEKLLLKMPYYHQLDEQNWFELFQSVVTKDQVIDENRKRFIELGIISKIKYDPMTRQAFNWLYGKADASNVVTPENKDDIVERFTNLVMAYGGAVICSIFTRHEAELKKVLNWRTGYFFEHIIYKVYTIEEITKIKTADLARANPSLVKKVLLGV